MAADEVAFLGQPGNVAVREDSSLGELFRSQARVKREGTDAAVDVEPSVFRGRAVASRNLPKLLDVLVQDSRHLL